MTYMQRHVDGDIYTFLFTQSVEVGQISSDTTGYAKHISIHVTVLTESLEWRCDNLEKVIQLKARYIEQ